MQLQIISLHRLFRGFLVIKAPHTSASRTSLGGAPAPPRPSLGHPGSSPDVGEEEMARTEGELLASSPLGALVFFFLPVCPSHVSKQWTL